MIPILLMLQTTVIAPGAPQEQQPLAGPIATSQRCPIAEDGQITVCARRTADENYRLKPLPERYSAYKQAQLKLSGGKTITLHGEHGVRENDGQLFATFSVPF